VTPPLGKCVWCDGIDFTEEHIIGRQFAKALGIRYPVESHWGDFILPNNASEITLRDRVCKTCNLNWMRKLDNRIMKFMRPSIHHEERTQLNQRKQAALATWATKVALLLQLRTHDLVVAHPELYESGFGYVPDDNLAAIRRCKSRPPERTRVWLGAVHSHDVLPKFAHCGGGLAAFEDSEQHNGLALPVRHGYFELFVLGRLVFYLTGWEIAYDKEMPDINPQAIVGGRAMRRIWPTSEQVTEWPPQQRLGTNDLERMVNMPADWSQSPQGRRRLVSTPQTT
jgi:hypothetical protein